MENRISNVTMAKARLSTVLLIACACLGTMTGCRLCADCDLDSYPSYGGAWQRTLRDSGRVGSVFDPGGSRVADLSNRITPEQAENDLHSGNAPEPRDGEPAGDGSRNEGTAPDDSTEDNFNDRNLDDDQQLRDMEERLKDLDLQDINYRRPDGNSQDWH